MDAVGRQRDEDSVLAVLVAEEQFCVPLDRAAGVDEVAEGGFFVEARDEVAPGGQAVDDLGLKVGRPEVAGAGVEFDDESPVALEDVALDQVSHQGTVESSRRLSTSFAASSDVFILQLCGLIRYGLA